jgi:hypothetical protein
LIHSYSLRKCFGIDYLVECKELNNVQCHFQIIFTNMLPFI